MTPPPRDVLRSIAALGLPTATLLWPQDPLQDGQWEELRTSVRHERLMALQAAAVARGLLPVTERQHEDVVQAEFESSLAVLLLEATTVQTVEVLEDAGVAPRVLKGPAVAQLDYDDKHLRLFSDVDLIVRGEQFDTAVAALTEAGFRRRHRQPRPGFDRRFSKGTSFITPNGLEIDLHRTFVMGPFGLRVDLDDVWEHGRAFSLAGRQLEALDDEVRFLHACYHAALGNIEPRLVPQRDVAQMLLSGRLDEGRVATLVDGWSAAPVVARAVSTAWRTLRLEPVPLAAWAAARRPSGREARDLAVYSDPDGSYAAKSLAAVRTLPTWRDRAAFAYALTFPERSYVDGRYRGASERWLRGVRAAGHAWTRR